MPAYGSTVHPCAGREHGGVLPHVGHMSGSPLRGQGTLFDQQVAQGLQRFTPARAGNTTTRNYSHCRRTVHPCAGREHVTKVSDTSQQYGSPLRGQGTLSKRRPTFVRHRFTPARAGNTLTVSAAITAGTVHPCAGREHASVKSPSCSSTGSPLRGQGTRWGTTPATPTEPVHPCAGREHQLLLGSSRAGSGSPLRGQGTHRKHQVAWSLTRFTPARAGNTLVRTN